MPLNLMFLQFFLGQHYYGELHEKWLNVQELDKNEVMVIIILTWVKPELNF